MIAPITFNPIGVLKSDQVEPYQASRQPDGLSNEAVIKLNSGHNFEQALTDLDGCSHLWIIYAFHKNENWKPLVQTPRSNRKIGVFATRAPYRPNPIGMSLVKLEKIDGLDIHLGPNDLLDGTPILDIKPYHPESDVAEDARIDWLESSLTPKMHITFSPLATDHLDFLENQNSDLEQIKSFIFRQLEYDPTNDKKKRVEFNHSYWILAYRTWRIDFIVQDETVAVLGIRSGYTPEELESADDHYQDKAIHRSFIKNF
jgi:tRNA-Thr(GGU) m(6)t(6)A37 methyltransferase TsaA